MPRVMVSFEIPAKAFTSVWESRTDAEQDYVRFLEEAWRGDLEPLREAGVTLSLRVGVGRPESRPKPAVEIHVDPAVGNEAALDMMARTRELLTDQNEVWRRWLKSPGAKALSGG